MARENLWTNSDGLIVGFGRHTTDEAVATKMSAQGVEVLQLRIVGNQLLDAAVPDALQAANSVTIPAGAYVKSATLLVHTAFTSGGAATLDVGSLTAAGAIADDDGFVAAAAVASLTANADIAGAGALVGTVLASAAKVYASYDTAAFTAGEAILVVEYIPKSI